MDEKTIHPLKDSSLNVSTSLGGRKPFIEELQFFLEKKLLNPRITKDAFLVYLAKPTSFALDLNFSH